MGKEMAAGPRRVVPVRAVIPAIAGAVGVAILAATFPALAFDGEAAWNARRDLYVALACDALGYQNALEAVGEAMEVRIEALGSALSVSELDGVTAVLAEENESAPRVAALYCRDKAREAMEEYGREASLAPKS